MTKISLSPSGQVRLTFEAHHIDIAPTGTGMAVLVRILETTAQAPKIAEPARPTQWQVDEWLKAYQANQAIRDITPKVNLRKLGL